MAYLLSINRTIRGKLPKDATPGQWAHYNDTFENVELTAGELAAEIRAGHAIAAQHDGRRKAANWRLAQHVGVDLDDGRLSWDEVVELPAARHAAIVHTTASHTPAHPRMRVLFLLEEPLRDARGYSQVVQAILRAFDTADPHCTDPSRLFFGAPDCGLLLMPENVLSPDDIGHILTAYPAPAPTSPVGEVTPRPRPAGDNGGDIVPPDLISARRLDAHSEALLDKIRRAPDGTKWATLRQVSHIFGGYVKSGYYKRDAIEKRLKAAIETRRATVASMPHAYKTIELGLDSGEAEGALWYTRGDDAPPGPAGRAPDPAADFRQKVMADRLAELEALINAADLDTPDFGDIVSEYAELQRALVGV